MGPPLFQFLSRICEREEETHIQAFIPQPAIKALDISVLYGLAWSNEVQADSMTIRPRIRILRLGLLQDGNVGVGIFLEGEEILIGRLGPDGVALHCRY